jgi:hypothetical protein
MPFMLPQPPWISIAYPKPRDKCFQFLTLPHHQASSTKLKNLIAQKLQDIKTDTLNSFTAD